jgi:hypothetical protein
MEDSSPNNLSKIPKVMQFYLSFLKKYFMFSVHVKNANLSSYYVIALCVRKKNLNN